jgi:hypothetical protein
VTEAVRGGSEQAPADVSRNPLVLEPKASRTVELGKLRRSELESISDRLGRMSRIQWDRFWYAAAGVFLGAGLGGGFALLAVESPTTSQLHRVWFGITAAVFIALVCFLAGLSTKSQRDDSIAAIKMDLDKIWNAYPLPDQKEG